MMTKIYLFLAVVGGVIGPQRSPWTSSNTFSARYAVAFGNGSLACLPRRHDAHVSLSTDIFGNPITSSFFTIIFNDSDPIWPRRACHVVASSRLRVWRHSDSTHSIMTLYNRFFDRLALVIRFPSLS
ncbi:hypothetical protein YC2023_099731 [Brassica napus]